MELENKQPRMYYFYNYKGFMVFKSSRLSVLMLLVFVVACRKETTQPTPVLSSQSIADNDHILLGNPTGATEDVNTPENYFINATYYKQAYSKTRGIPVWVSWHLQSSDLGSTPRQDDFRANTSLPAGWYQAQSNAVSGSGFDRGHNIPSGDRTSSIAANSSTFMMTNIIPQAPNFNQGPWEGLEDFIRTQVGTSNEAYIIMGNYGKGGYNTSNVYAEAVDNGRMTVPKKVWKVALIIPKGDNDLGRMNRNTTVITVTMPNNHSLYTITSTGKNAWRNYLISVSSLEQEAKAEGQELDLLSNVPDSIRTVLKGKVY